MAKKQKTASTAPQGQRITLEHIANITGVSVGMVSRVLNSKPSGLPIAEQTRKSILSTARQLHYAPNFLARSLRLKKTNTLGVLTFSMASPYSSTLIQAINKAAMNHGFHIICCDSEYSGDAEAYYINLFLSQKVDGLIIVNLPVQGGPSWFKSEDGAMRTLPPVVLINEIDERLPYCYVNANKKSGAEIAADYLISKGYRKLSVLSENTELRVNSELVNRRDSFLKRCAEKGLPLRSDWIIPTRLVSSETYNATKKLFASSDYPEALFAMGDEAAIGAIRAAVDCGLRVPEDIAIIGYDDIPAASWFIPRITTIRQPLEIMGKSSVDMLVDLVYGKELKEIHLSYEPELIVRESA
jgi:LacI family transcriptional regulator